ncbi:MAG: DUF6717 family protein [Gemmataceae bacterium]
MPEPIFPAKPSTGPRFTGVIAVEPYRTAEGWAFDDPRVGLVAEPFVGEINVMLDRLVAGLPDASNGVRLLFSAEPFSGQQATLTWLRADAVEGNWYRCEEMGIEGWLCPALFWYFATAPERIHVGVQAK